MFANQTSDLQQIVSSGNLSAGSLQAPISMSEEVAVSPCALVDPETSQSWVTLDLDLQRSAQDLKFHFTSSNCSHPVTLQILNHPNVTILYYGFNDFTLPSEQQAFLPVNDYFTVVVASGQTVLVYQMRFVTKVNLELKQQVIKVARGEDLVIDSSFV